MRDRSPDATIATAFWTRLDTDGHDACRLARTSAGWRLAGCATFLHEAKACALAYAVDCDDAWRTLSARVDGFVGHDRLVFDVSRAGDTWLMNGMPQPDAAGQIDLDLGFTPATNLLALRRLDLAQGAHATAPAAYYLEFTTALGRLDQTYRRLDENRYAYESPAHGYRAELVVHPTGFVTDYPGLWRGVVSTA